jgi:hypothetical protein
MITLKPLQALTTAPENYDYEWVRTIAYNVATDSRGNSLRLVEHTDEWHYKNQIARYGSGLNRTYDAIIWPSGLPNGQKRLDDDVNSGFLTINPQPTPVFYHVIEINMDDYVYVYKVASTFYNIADANPDTVQYESYYGHMYLRVVGNELNAKVAELTNQLGLTLKPRFDTNVT